MSLKKPKQKRLSWEQYALALAEVAALRSNDPFEKVGCCLLRHNHTVASLGYNGFISGATENWRNRDARRPYVVHAEANAMRYVKPGECYLAACTLLSCNDCIKDLASYGITTLVYRKVYAFDDTSLKMAKAFRVKLIQIP